jgi:hypothetical protein
MPERVGPFGHDAGNERDAGEVQFMGHSLDPDRLDERVGDDHLLLLSAAGSP